MSEERKQNKALYILTHDFKYEGLVLLLLAVVAVVLGAMIVVGVSSEGQSGLIVNPNAFLIGDFPLTFAWILIALGVVSFILAVWPFYKPSISELRRVAWPTKGKLMSAISTVFLFILFLSVFFFVVDIGLTQVTSLFTKLAEWLATL